MTDLVRKYFGFGHLAAEARSLRLLLDLAASSAGADEGAIFAPEPGTDNLVRIISTDRYTTLASVDEGIFPGENFIRLALLTGEVQSGVPAYENRGQAATRASRDGYPTAIAAAPLLLPQAPCIGVMVFCKLTDGATFNREAMAQIGRAAGAGAVIFEQSLALRRAAALGMHEKSFNSAEERLKAKLVADVISIAENYPEQLGELSRLLASLNALMAKHPR